MKNWQWLTEPRWLLESKRWEALWHPWVCFCCLFWFLFFFCSVDRNTIIPCKKSKIFSTHQDNQDSVLIKVVEMSIFCCLLWLYFLLFILFFVCNFVVIFIIYLFYHNFSFFLLFTFFYLSYFYIFRCLKERGRW